MKSEKLEHTLRVFKRVENCVPSAEGKVGNLTVPASEQHYKHSYPISALQAQKTYRFCRWHLQHTATPGYVRVMPSLHHLPSQSAHHTSTSFD